MTDPLAGIPITTSITPKARKGAPTNINTARKRKLTATEYKGARDQARSVTGYNDTSPIWGKPTLDVLKGIDDLLAAYTSTGEQKKVADARVLNEELRKRFLSYKLTSDAAK